MPAWLRGHHRLSQGEAGRLVRNGRALEQLPALAAAASRRCGDGGGGRRRSRRWRSAENLARAEAQGVDVAAIDAALAEVARPGRTPSCGRSSATTSRGWTPTATEPDPTESAASSTARDSKGMVSGRFVLDAVGGEKFQAAIESILQASRPAGDVRTRAQRQADALVQLCDNALASGSLPILRGHKPHVGVLIDHEDLMDPTTGAGAGRTGFGGVISAAKARWLACDGNVTRIVIGPDGQPLDLGQTTRLFHRTCAGPWRYATGTACSPAATPQPLVRRPPRHPLDRRRRHRPGQRARCANATTPRSTTASGSPANPTADGAPGAPTAPRSSSTR